MRYYDLSITGVTDGKVVRHWTSHPSGPNDAPDRGALQIEFDLPISPQATPLGNDSGGGADYTQPFVRVWGIPLSDIVQAANLSAPTGGGGGYNLVLKGGMAKGLPLANPKQIGTIVKGGIWRAIGNWIGRDMTVDFYLTQFFPVGDQSGNGSAASSGNTTGTGSVPALPINNFTFNWPAGQDMATAINNTLKIAFPSMPRYISISPQLKLSHDQAGWYTTIRNFSEMVNRLSLGILGAGNPGYRGITAFARDGAIWVTDDIGGAAGGAQAPKPATININFTDLIGQPTWVGNNTIQVTTVLRGDIAVGDSIIMPPTLTTVSAQGGFNSTIAELTGGRFSSGFQGKMLVTDLRQVGNYKAPQAASWVTALIAIQTPGPAVTSAPPPTSSPEKTPAPVASIG